MNKNGFSSVLVVLGLAVLLVVLWLAWGKASRANGINKIKSEITSLGVGLPLQSENCNTGDGVDSLPTCNFVYSGDDTQIESTLQSAGYSSTQKASNEIDSVTRHHLTKNVFTGGTPNVEIDYTVDHNAKTTTLNVSEVSK